MTYTAVAGGKTPGSWLDSAGTPRWDGQAIKLYRRRAEAPRRRLRRDMVMSTDSVSNAGMDMAGVEITDFYQHYRQPLLAYLTRIVQDRDTAEELCHDSFVKVLQHWRERNQQQDVRAWLYRIAKNIAYDQLRRWRRRPNVPLSEAWDSVDEQSDGEKQER